MSRDPFEALDANVPLLLLPVRVDTRFRLHTDPPRLCLRILPDQVHVAPGTAAPGKTERELTIQFWMAWHERRNRKAAWQRFVRRVGAERAGHLARLLRPRENGQGGLVFPTITGATTPAPAGPQLLPRQWIAFGCQGNVEIFRKLSLPVREGLRTGPDPAAPAWEAAKNGIQVDEGIAWLVDYDQAIEAGMAITIDLTGPAAAAVNGVDTLLVLGLMSDVDPDDAAVRLDGLLRAHSRALGMAFVPQGTPTNNTESAPSGWSRSGAEPAELEIEPVEKVPGGNAARFAEVLGLADDQALRRLANGTDRERARSRAMVRVTFEALLGTMMRELLDVGQRNGVLALTANTIRAWCVDHVTGGAHYPCLRIGSQPYGLLPVQKSSPGPLQDMVSLLEGEWRKAAATLPVLDHNREATDTASVLASQPHPARLFVRRLDGYADVSGLQELLTPQWFYANVVLGGIDSATNPQLASPYTEIGFLYQSATANQEIDSVDTQLAVWRDIKLGVPGFLTSLGKGELVDEAAGWIDAVISLLSAWEQRHHPVRWLDLAAFAGVLGEQATALVEGVLWASSTEWAWPLVEGTEASAAEYLTDLATRFRARLEDGTLPPTGMSPEFVVRQPLLYQLVDRSLHLTPRGVREEQAIAEALELLATVPAAELEWLLREALGLGMHRLDAWRTSIAAERLQRLRDLNPSGVHIGAFGWVQNLLPRQSFRPSTGYVHAPSLSQAATAAILRSGWQAHGSDDPLSPVAVDLRSARVRTATWLLDGVRAGQDLGDLLGYRFERSLHDAKADEQIRPVRRAVLAAAGKPDASPDQPVDGLALLDLARAAGLNLPSSAVAAAIADLEGAFDAVNDASLVEAVHQLATGNFGRATAMLDAMTGTHSPPELLAPQTVRDGVSVEHRILILLDPQARAPEGSGWVSGLRDRIAPALEAWVASVLPPAGQVAVSGEVTLADLRVSALDAVYLVGDDPSVPSASLMTLTEGVKGTGGGAIPYPDFAVIAIELRRSFEALRVANACDVDPSMQPLVELADAEAATVEVLGLFSPEADAAALARFGSTVADAPRRLKAMRGAESLEKKMAAVFGARVPMLGRFPIPALPSVAGEDEVDGWFDAMARVRPAVGRLFTAGMAAELSSVDGGLRVMATQEPWETGEPWAALHRPVTPRGTRSMVLVTGPAGLPGGGHACGLVVDQWAERIPSPRQVTGVAVQHDAPTNRPPQSWLLAVTPPDQRWSERLVLDTLLETLDQVAQRAVGPEDLMDYGRAIPSVFVPGNVVNWPASAKASEGEGS